MKLYASRQARGRGIAHDLLAHAERLLFEDGVAKAELFRTAGNLRAQKFYAREGWRLGRTFQDARWPPENVPENVNGGFTVETHAYQKHLGFR